MLTRTQNYDSTSYQTSQPCCLRVRSLHHYPAQIVLHLSTWMLIGKTFDLKRQIKRQRKKYKNGSQTRDVKYDYSY